MEKKNGKIFGMVYFNERIPYRDTEQWEKSGLYCPRCGNQKIRIYPIDPNWDQEAYVCEVCKINFHVLSMYPDSWSNNKIEHLGQRIR